MPGKHKKPKPHKKPRHAPAAARVVVPPVVTEVDTKVGPPLHELVVEDFCHQDKDLRPAVVRAALRNILRRFGKK